MNRLPNLAMIILDGRRSLPTSPQNSARLTRSSPRASRLEWQWRTPNLAKETFLIKKLLLRWACRFSRPSRWAHRPPIATSSPSRAPPATRPSCLRCMCSTKIPAAAPGAESRQRWTTARTRWTSPPRRMTGTSTPSPPIKNSDFRGFDSSKFLILKGGNSHVRRI